MSKKILLAFIILLITAGVAGFWFWRQSTSDLNEIIETQPIVSLEEKKTIKTNEEIIFFDFNTHLDQSAKATDKNLLANNQADVVILSPPPFSESTRGTYDGEVFENLSDEKIVFASGGGSLNVLIQKYGGQTSVSVEIEKEFRAQAEEIIASGAAAFGEMAALHLALGQNHPFEEVAPNHPLFLLLSDLSAESGLPILMHMEAVAKDKPTPTKLRSAAPNNPANLKENITAFEELLDHNREAKIIWLQAGWDHTGDRTIELMTELLDRHPNLFLGLKTGTDCLAENSPLDSSGELKDEWKEFLTEYADQIVIASDVFLSPENKTAEPNRRQDGSIKIISGLPKETAEKIAYKNAAEIFGLKLPN